MFVKQEGFKTVKTDTCTDTQMVPKTIPARSIAGTQVKVKNRITKKNIKNAIQYILK